MLKRLLSDEQLVVHIKTSAEWQQLIELVYAHGGSIYNHDAFEEGWRFFGVSNRIAPPVELCGYGSHKAQNYSHIDILQLVTMLGETECDQESEIEIDFDFL